MLKKEKIKKIKAELNLLNDLRFEIINRMIVDSEASSLELFDEYHEIMVRTVRLEKKLTILNANNIFEKIRIILG